MEDEVGKFFSGYNSIAEPGQRSKDEIKKCKRLKDLTAKRRRDTMPSWPKTVKAMPAAELFRLWKKRLTDWAAKLDARGDKKEASAHREKAAQASIHPSNSRGLLTTDPPLVVLRHEVITGGRQSYTFDMEPCYGSMDLEERKLLAVPSFTKSVHKEWVGKDRDKGRQTSKADAKRDRERSDWHEGYTAKCVHACLRSAEPCLRSAEPSQSKALPSLYMMEAASKTRPHYLAEIHAKSGNREG